MSGWPSHLMQCADARWVQCVSTERWIWRRTCAHPSVACAAVAFLTLFASVCDHAICAMRRSRPLQAVGACVKRAHATLPIAVWHTRLCISDEVVQGRRLCRTALATRMAKRACRTRARRSPATAARCQARRHRREAAVLPCTAAHRVGSLRHTVVAAMAAPFRHRSRLQVGHRSQARWALGAWRQAWEAPAWAEAPVAPAARRSMVAWPRAWGTAAAQGTRAQTAWGSTLLRTECMLMEGKHVAALCAAPGCKAAASRNLQWSSCLAVSNVDSASGHCCGRSWDACMVCGTCMMSTRV